MPLLSNLSMLFLILANAGGAWALVAKFALPVWVALKGAAVALAGAISWPIVAIIAIIAVIATVITYFGWWDDILNAIVGTIKWLFQCMVDLINLLMTGTWYERLGALGSLISGPAGWAARGMTSSEIGNTNRSDQTFNQTFNIEKTADAEDVVDIVNDDMAYNLGG